MLRILKPSAIGYWPRVLESVLIKYSDWTLHGQVGLEVRLLTMGTGDYCLQHHIYCTIDLLYVP